MSYTLASIRSQVLAKLNDLDQAMFTDDVLLPYAKDAGDELQLELELNGILVLESTSASITVPIGTISLVTAALMPADMLDPQRVSERLSGSTDLFSTMIRREWEPEVTATDSLRYWTFREQDIKFVGATQIRDIKINYLKRLINLTAWTDTVNVNNSQQFMINRIASFAAMFTGENKVRADELARMAAQSMEKLIGIGVKSKQGARTRRRPYTIAGARRWA